MAPRFIVPLLFACFLTVAATPPNEFSARTAQGDEISSGTTRGKVVVLTWWANWCAPCLKELRDFDKIYRRFQRDGLELIALDADMQDEGYRLRRPPGDDLSFPFAIAFQGFAFPLEGVPTTYVINRAGKTVAIFHGSVDPHLMKALLSKLLSEKRPTIPHRVSP